MEQLLSQKPFLGQRHSLGKTMKQNHLVVSSGPACSHRSIHHVFAGGFASVRETVNKL